MLNKKSGPCNIVTSIPKGDTSQMVFWNGIPVAIPNVVVISKEDFYVSYNQSSWDYGCPTTAVVVGNCSGFFVLVGNHTDYLINKSWVDVYNYLTNLDDSQFHHFSENRNFLSESLTDTIDSCKEAFRKLLNGTNK